jgi:malonyl-CoA/methylmalonyl-CoA synthetase
VVGVSDAEYGQRVGAAVTLSQQTELTLEDLRSGLRSKLPGCKMPTLLRVVPGELPKGATGKVSKKILSPLYFRDDGGWASDASVQVWAGSAKSKL